MVTATMEDVRVWQGKTLVDSQGQKIGQIADVYFDQETGQPEWALVNSGLFGNKHNFVPISAQQQQGDTVQVQWTKSQVTNAPKIDDDQELTIDEERELYQYYGIDWQQSESGTVYPAGQTQGQQRQGQQPQQQAQQAQQRQGAMTRSEEELHVGTHRRPTELVRLRKYITTENVTQTVPVQREEVRVERVPVTEANRAEAMSGPEMTENTHEVTLTAEEPAVEKRVVPKEQVSLQTDTVTSEEQVSEQVRKEQIDLERDPGRRE